MCQFIETIKVVDGEVKNIKEHIDRVNYTRSQNWEKYNKIIDNDIIKLINKKEGTIKLRFTYDNINIYQPTCTQYRLKQVKHIKLITDNTIEYAFKSIDRESLNKLKLRVKQDEEVLIVKCNRLTDTSYTNIALYDGIKWVTPSIPLLNGTKRRQLIKQRKLIEVDLTPKDIGKYKAISLINAMIELEELILPITEVRL